MIKYVTDPAERARIAREVLEDLPEWFGIKESTEEYIKGCMDMPFWGRCSDTNEDQGFICLKETGPHTCEIYCMGVKKEFQGQGFGKEMWEFFKHHATNHGYTFAQVKTLCAGVTKEYDLTNRFYKSIGFEEFELIPTLWDEKNPCQIYIQSLDSGLFDFF